MERRGSIFLLRWVQVLLFLGIDGALLYAWGVFLGSWFSANPSPIIGVLTAAGLLLGAAVFSYLMLSLFHSTMRAQIPITLVGLLVAIWPILMRFNSAYGSANVGDPSYFLLNIIGIRGGLAAILTFLFWWRGSAAAVAGPSLSASQTRFRVTTVMFLVLLVLILIASPAHSVPVGGIVGSVLVALFASLVSLPVARIIRISEREASRGAHLDVNTQWLSMLVGITVGLLVIAFILAGSISGQLLSIVTALRNFLWTVFSPIVLLGGYIVSLIVDLIQRLLNSGESSNVPPPEVTPVVPHLRKPLTPEHPSTGAPAFFEWLLLAIVVVVFLVVAVVLIRKVVSNISIEHQPEGDFEETRRFVWSWSSFLSGLKLWLRSLFQRRRTTVAPAEAPSGEQPQAAWTGRGIAELYRELLHLGSRLGRRRASHETPNEYERALGNVDPLERGDAEIRTITSVYSDARYGDEQPRDERLESARAALDRLKRMEQEARMRARQGEINGERADDNTERNNHG